MLLSRFLALSMTCLVECRWGFDSSWELKTGMGQLVSLGISIGFIFRSQSSRPSVIQVHMYYS